MSIGWILGKWRRVKAHGHKGGEKSWLTYQRYYNEAKREPFFLSLREHNKLFGGKPMARIERKLNHD